MDSLAVHELHLRLCGHLQTRRSRQTAPLQREDSGPCMRSIPAVTGAGLRAAEAGEGARPFPDSGHCGLLLPFGNQHRLSVS